MDTIAINAAVKEVKMMFPERIVDMAFATLSEILYRPSRSLLLVSKLLKRPSSEIVSVLENAFIVNGVHYFSTFDEQDVQITSKGLVSIALLLHDDVFMSSFTALINKTTANVDMLHSKIEATILAPAFKDPLAMEFVKLIDADYLSAVSMSANYVKMFLRSIKCNDHMHARTCVVLANVLRTQAGGEPTVASRKRKVADVIANTC
jgi:hypothetical protein